MSQPITLSYLKLEYDLAGQVESRFHAPVINSAFQHPTFTGTYDDDNRLLTVNASSVAHDDDGNMTNGPIRSDSGHLSLNYNARNQLVQADGLTYTYDAEGHRRTSTDADGATQFTIDPNASMSRLLVKRAPDGTKTYYVYGAGLLYEVDESENTKTYHFDQVGSTISRTDDSGKVIGRAEYTAYGIMAWHQGDMKTPFQYNGQWGIMTEANGLLNMRARYYSPYLMRFLNADPIGFSGGSNWFAYVGGDPIRKTDPFGLFEVFGWDVGGYVSGEQGWVPGMRTRSSMLTADEAGEAFSSGFAATVDGFVPFADPYADGWVPNYGPDNWGEEWYDESDSAYQTSKSLGRFSRDVALVAAGQPLAGSKAFILPGAARGSSFASATLRSVTQGAKLPFRVPTVVGTNLRWTNSLGGAAGRWVPFVGMGDMALQAGEVLSQK